jgi:hypothetical protein
MAKAKSKVENKPVAKKPSTKIKKEEVITQEDIQKALAEIVSEKMVGVKQFDEKVVEQPTEINTNVLDNLFAQFEQINPSQTPLHLQPIMYVLTRMYEASEVDYMNVKYNSEDGTIQINLDGNIYKDVDYEVNRVKNQLCYDTLKYKGHTLKGDNPRILIVISTK